MKKNSVLSLGVFMFEKLKKNLALALRALWILL